MRGSARSLVLAFALGGAAVSLWSREGRADMFCGGGEPPEPAPTASSSATTAPSGSSTSGADAGADGPTGLNQKRPCMSGSPWSKPSAIDFGMLAGMVLLGSGAAASSRKKAPEKKP